MLMEPKVDGFGALTHHRSQKDVSKTMSELKNTLVSFWFEFRHHPGGGPRFLGDTQWSFRGSYYAVSRQNVTILEGTLAGLYTQLQSCGAGALARLRKFVPRMAEANQGVHVAWMLGL